MSSRRLALLGFALSTLCGALAHAQPAAPASPAPAGDLQSPAQASTRNSAYTLPRGMWGFNVGGLGIGNGDAVATLGAAYGIGAGLQAEVNVAHMSVGLFNVAAAWHFVDTRYFDLGARAGFWYGHGAWYWIAPQATKELISKIDVISVPIELAASAPLSRWFQLDLAAAYTYGKIFGSGDRSNLFTDAQIAVRQFALRPGARLFLTDRTALEFSAKLPVSTIIPFDKADDRNVAFKYVWSFETGLRSRLAPGLFGSLRLHYGANVDAMYGARLYPAFEIEYRL